MQQQFIYQRDTQVFQTKPNSREAAGINVRLADVANQVEETLDQFISDCLRYSVAPFEIKLGGGVSLTADLWQRQQIFLFDVDNKPEVVGSEPVTAEEALLLLKEPKRGEVLADLQDVRTKLGEPGAVGRVAQLAIGLAQKR